jgi:hypothetical protein
MLTAATPERGANSGGAAAPAVCGKELSQACVDGLFSAVGGVWSAPDGTTSEGRGTPFFMAVTPFATKETPAVTADTRFPAKETPFAVKGTPFIAPETPLATNVTPSGATESPSAASATSPAALRRLPRFALAPAGQPQGPWQDGGLNSKARNMPIGPLIPGQNYVFQVRARGGSTGASDWSNPVGHMCM